MDLNRICSRLDPLSTIYPDSIHCKENTFFLIAKIKGKKVFLVLNDGEQYCFTGETTIIDGVKVRICDLSVENSLVLREEFPFTKPVPMAGKEITIGLGDRLGLASPAHIRLIRNRGIFPILAQQSIRELNLTGRNYQEVISDVVWAVFQEGYEDGYGADGDHLKTLQEIQMALDCGFTMITLDCSEHIDNTVVHMECGEIDALYGKVDAAEKKRLETKYLNREFDISGFKICFTKETLKRIVLIYLKAIRFTIDVYKETIGKSIYKIDFEMSIDETLTTTSPEQHFFVASELIDGGVRIDNLAPRFCGEFQKGIDYIGDIGQFTKEFTEHVKIAEHLGYKISVHSGSDKFKVFPVIGEKANGRYHLKTAGTNWLEAVRVLSQVSPSLYRRIHQFALANVQEARKYYHIKGEVFRVPDIDSMKDSELPDFLELEDSRQILHITYGLILQEKDTGGNYVFKDEIYNELQKHEKDYDEGLKKHIGRHIESLGIGK